jgi:murein DD-endopeptidase MepM/ murein hydrolase activator NlpD
LASGFGYRRDPFTRTRKFHDGIDITAPVGTPVRATADGTVESIQYYRNGYGLTLVVNHGYGYKTVYAHLSLSKVKRYQKVERGEVIALVGNSGRTTGPHLHYEVQITGKARNPLNYIIPDDKSFH